MPPTPTNVSSGRFFSRSIPRRRIIWRSAVCASLPVCPSRSARSAAFQPPPKPKTLFGLNFPNPVGLAAGFDKNGVALPALGGARLRFRRNRHRHREGPAGKSEAADFPVSGAGSADQSAGLQQRRGGCRCGAGCGTLRRSGRWPGIPVGINIGKSKVTPIEEAADDYLYSFRLLPRVRRLRRAQREFAEHARPALACRNTTRSSNCCASFTEKTRSRANPFC